MVPSPFCLSQVSGFPGFNKQGQRTMPKRLQTAARTDRNDSQDLLLILAYAKKLQETQRNLEEVCNLMQHKVPLEGLISAQDNRTLQSAKSCLQRLHVRVEALANVLEQTLISQQLQFMHAMAQHGQTSNSIVQFRSDPGDAPKESKPGNGLEGPADKEVMTTACNLQRDDTFVQELPWQHIYLGSSPVAILMMKRHDRVPAVGCLLIAFGDIRSLT